MSFKYRKMPVIIDAFQWTKEFRESMETGKTIECPQWLLIALGNNLIVPSTMNPNLYMIKTKEGWMQLPYNHWIIRGVEFELYSCDPAIFNKSYEKVET